MPGINQMGVNRKAGLDFAVGLRSILRADPDVIMVGEVRDPETARIAVEAALTGHMVLTTLHTNDAPSAITRLQKMGIESFLTASAVDCVVAQRLARTLCPDCKRRTSSSAPSSRTPASASAPTSRPGSRVGCGRCGGTGYRGRVGIFSVMTMTERPQGHDRRQRPAGRAHPPGPPEGMLTLREDGLAKVNQGITSIAEVARVAV